MEVNDEPSESQDWDCGFVWDEKSQLYFHASTGFYHDPNTGLYYNSRDGSSYKFENGSYVPLESEKGGEYDAVQKSSIVSDPAIQDDLCQKCISDVDPEDLPPPSEWLEETLINQYLTGYSNSVTNAADKLVMLPTEADAGCDSKVFVHGAENDGTHEIQYGECIEEDLQDATESSERLSAEGASWDEENWRAQYGQVVQSGEEGAPASSIIDLWNWAMITETVVKKTRRKKWKYQIARLTGKQVKPSTKLHPSMPSGDRRVKTAIISETNLALVRVSSGKVYRLKSPSLEYLSSLSTYDSSNPTKDWGFPEFSIDQQGCLLPKFTVSCDNDTLAACAESSASPDQPMVLEKNNVVAYRDRAAERRALHGGFGVGPGQKNPGRGCGMKTSPVSDSTEKAAAEALDMSFGVGSYARKLLENMGWKEGEALGKTTKGLLQPLEAKQNKGFAGIGWNQRETISQLKL